MTARKDTLIDALLTLKTAQEAKDFLSDLCTPAEIEALEERWLLVKMLSGGDLSYRDISAKTGASTTTIGRVARFLLKERHRGYQLALERLGLDNNEKEKGLEGNERQSRTTGNSDPREKKAG